MSRVAPPRPALPALAGLLASLLACAGDDSGTAASASSSSASSSTSTSSISTSTTGELTATGGATSTGGGTSTGDATTSTSSTTGADPIDPGADAHAAFLWQGFDHAWLRTVLGFRIPHRVSKLATFISDPAHVGEGDDWSGSATLTFRQDTGVDGNFMRPRGRYVAVHAPGLYAQVGAHALSWSDSSVGDPEFPEAHSELAEEIVVDLGTPALADGALERYDAVLTGIDLRTSCDDAKQTDDAPCNSDGMWPFRFAIALDACDVDGEALRCPLAVSIHRGWTPNKGGLANVDEKPYNAVLDFDLTVHYAVLGGDAEALAITRGDLITTMGAGHDDLPMTGAATLQGLGGGAYPKAAVAVAAFGFTLWPLGDTPSHKRRGRYINGLRFTVAEAAYDPSRGDLDYDHTSQVFLPATVINSGVTFEHRAALIQLAEPAARVSGGEAEGRLCINSKDAPFYSKWTQCDDPDKGPEQSDDAALISAP